MLVLILFLASLASWAQIPTGGAAGVGGAGDLTTVGAIPYVSAPGALNQDPTALFWDAANNFLYAGGYTNPSTYSVRLGTENGEISIRAGAGAITHSGANMAIGSTGSMSFNSNSVERARFAPTGDLLIGTTTDSNFKLDVAASGSAGTMQVYDATATTGTTRMVVRAGAGQSTTNLTEWQDSAGNILARVANSGDIVVNASIQSPNFFTTDSASAYFVIRGAGGAAAFAGLSRGQSQFAVFSDYKIGFLSGTNINATTTSADTAIARSSAGLLEVNGGTAIGTTPGNARDARARGFYTAETTSDPSAAELSIAGSNAQDTFRLYMKNDKLVVAYNRSGTVNYLTIPLDGATTTWTQSTTAP